MDVHQEILPHGNANQVALDFGDQLPPGYRYCPTDSELIVYYLNPKIESRKLPECRLHEVNIYNHKPEELAERYRSSVDKWYFLTPRDRKYPKGDRPSRTVKHFGYWKATQKQRKVLDASRQMVGYKTTLAFHDKQDNKTMWLMHEYLSNGLNIPCGRNTNKLNDWVLCKIYKHKTKKTSNSNPANQEGAINQERNKTDDKPTQKRKRVSKNSYRLGNNNVHDMVAPLSNNNIIFGSNQQSVEKVRRIEGLTTSMGCALYTSSNQGVGFNNGATMQPTASFQGWSSIQPIPFYQNHQSTCNESNIGFQFQNCASSSCMKPLDHVGAQPLIYGGYTTATFNDSNPIQTTLSECYQNPSSFIEPPNAAAQPLYYGGYTPIIAPTPVINLGSLVQQHVQDSYEDSPTLLVEQNEANQAMVMPQDADIINVSQRNGDDGKTSPSDPNEWSFDIFDEADRFPLPDDYSATLPAVDEIDWTLEYIDSCFDYENTSVSDQ